MYFRDYFLIFVEFSLLTYFFYFSYQALSQKEKDKIFRPGWPIYYSLYKYLQRTIYFIIFEKKLEQKWNLIFKKSTYTRKIEILKIRIKKRYNKNEMRKALDLEKFELPEKKVYSRKERYKNDRDNRNNPK